MKLVLFAMLVACSACSVAAQPMETWTQLSWSTCGVDEFFKQHPDRDGRGVVVAIIDTGVEPNRPGLTKTPNGEVKVIDVQDFSGQGDLDLHRVYLDKDGKIVHHADDGAAIQYTPPEDMPAGEDVRMWFAVLKEKLFANSAVSDLNDNDKTDDKFPILVMAREDDGDDDAVAYVDTNLDRSFADEKQLKNYQVRYDSFTWKRPQPEEQYTPLTYQLNVFLKQRKVVLHFDDGGHGTHVAGIAAGFEINGQKGLNGVAPGAKVISLKLSNNNIGAVTTSASKMKCFEYAARYAREHNVPVVCNVSFGVGSVLEGHSDIDEALDALCRKNPYLIVCTSAGNEGPGLSTIGTPSATPSAIACGAVLAADTARDTFGWDLAGPVVTLFSSRGAETLKPDVMTPGWMTSTVTFWSKDGDFWAGTSMSSPYAAGLCAVLVSDAMTTYPGVPVRSSFVKRALAHSARKLPDTTANDIGPGIPDLSKAAESLHRMLAGSEADPLFDYEISTPSPHGVEGKAPAAYWRSVYHPTASEQVFTISPIWMPGADEDAANNFVRKFDLRCDSAWCRPKQQSVYLRSNQDATVSVAYDASKLTEPGVYVATVEGVRDGQVEFSLRNTVVVPHAVGADDNYTFTTKGVADGWKVNRFFVNMPAGTSAIQMTLSAPEGERSNVSASRIFMPTGRRLRNGACRLDTDHGRREAKWNLWKDLNPGVWEFDVAARRADEQAPFEYRVRFLGLSPDTPTIDEWSNPPGQAPSGELTVTNLFDTLAPCSGGGMIEGFRKTHDDTFEGIKDKVTHEISLDPAYDRVRIRLEMTPEAFAETTDVGVQVLHGDKAIYDGAMGFEDSEFTVNNPDPEAESVSLKLVISAGFTTVDDERETPMTVKIDMLLGEPIDLSVTRGDSERIDFVPGVPTKVDFEASASPPDVEGRKPVGYLAFTERSSGVTMLRVPIEID